MLARRGKKKKQSAPIGGINIFCPHWLPFINQKVAAPITGGTLFLASTPKTSPGVFRNVWTTVRVPDKISMTARTSLGVHLHVRDFDSDSVSSLKFKWAPVRGRRKTSSDSNWKSGTALMKRAVSCRRRFLRRGRVPCTLNPLCAADSGFFHVPGRKSFIHPRGARVHVRRHLHQRRDKGCDCDAERWIYYVFILFFFCAVL